MSKLDETTRKLDEVSRKLQDIKSLYADIQQKEGKGISLAGGDFQAQFIQANATITQLVDTIKNLRAEVDKPASFTGKNLGMFSNVGQTNSEIAETIRLLEQQKVLTRATSVTKGDTTTTQFRYGAGRPGAGQFAGLSEIVTLPPDIDSKIANVTSQAAQLMKASDQFKAGIQVISDPNAVTALISKLGEIRNTLGGSSEPIDKLQAGLAEVGKRGAITAEEFQKVLNYLTLIKEEAKELAKTGTTTPVLEGLSSGLSEAHQMAARDVGAYKFPTPNAADWDKDALDKELFDQRPERKIALGEDWRENLRGFTDQVKDSGVKEFSDKVEVSIRNLREFMENVENSGATIDNLKLSFNDAATALDALFTIQKREGNIIGEKTQTSARVEVGGEVTNYGPPSHVISSVGELGPIFGASLDQDKQLYSNLDPLLAKIKSDIETVKGSSKDVSIELKQWQIQADKASGSIVATADYVKRLGDKVETGKVFRQFNIGPGQSVTEGSPDRMANYAGLFDASAQTTFVKNLTEAMKENSFTANDMTGAHKDAASNLTRISLVSGTVETGMRTLNLTFNEQGNLVNDLSNRYSGFFKALEQNFSRVLRWAIATSTIYAALNKLQEIPGVIAEIDQATARMGALSGRSLEQVQEYFTSTLRVAKQFGVEMRTALPASEFALQAAGGVDEDTAMTLLADSMLLAKVTGDDLNTTIETLTAALNQYNMELDQGRELIGKWLALNRANSSTPGDFVRTFAVAGAQAREFIGKTEEDLDKFNSLISVTSEVTPLSDAELGNFYKTMLTTSGTGAAEDVLQKYGISARDSERNLRNYYDVMEEIYLLTVKYQALSPDALKEIANVLAGGPRQAGHFLSTITGFDKTYEARDVSSSAVESRTEEYDKLVNALVENLKDNFQGLSLEVTEFIKVFSESSLLPFLDDVTTSLRGIFEFINSLDKGIINTITSIGSMLAMILPLRALITKIGVPNNLSVADAGNAFMKLVTPDVGAALNNATNAAAKSASLNVAGVGTGIALSIISGIAAGLRSEEGSLEVALKTSLLTALGAVAAGAAFGPQAAIIGGSIMNAIASQLTLTRAPDESFVEELITEFGGWGSAKDDQEFFDRLGENYPEQLDQKWLASYLTEKETPYVTSVTDMGSRDSWFDNFTSYRDRLEQGVSNVSESSQQERLLEESERARASQIADRTAQRREGINLEYAVETPGSVMSIEKERIRRSLLTQLSMGEINVTDYKKAGERLDELPDSVVTTWDALGEKFEEAGTSFYDLLEILTSLDPSELTYFDSLATKLVTMRSEMELNIITTEQFTAAQEEANIALKAITQRESYNLPSISKVDQTEEEFDENVIEGRKVQKAVAMSMYFADEEGFRQKGFESFEAFYEGYVERAGTSWFMGDAFIKDVAGLYPWAYSIGEGMGEKMREGMEDAFNVRRLKDMDPSKIGEIERGNRYWVNYLANLRGQSSEEYIQEEGIDMNLIMGENNVFHKILTTNEAMNFVLQDILDTEKKQLEGMWNIPDGASFWVPITSLFYNQGGGGANYPDMPPIQDTRTPRGGAEDSLITSDEFLESMANRRAIQKEKTNVEYDIFAANRLRMDERSLGRDQVLPAKSEREMSLLSTYDSFKAFDYKSILPAMLSLFKPAPETNWNNLRSVPDRVTDQKPLASPNINVVVPEIRDVTVESTLNAVLTLDGRVISTLVKQSLSRELNRVTRTMRHSVPGMSIR